MSDSIIRDEQIDIYLADGRYFCVREFPHYNAMAHIDYHVGINVNKDRTLTHNVNSTTHIKTSDGKFFNLTPALKKTALFFCYPSGFGAP